MLFKFFKISYVIANILNALFKRVTRMGRGKVSPALSLKLEKSALILGKNAPIVVIYGSNFSLKM